MVVVMVVIACGIGCPLQIVLLGAPSAVILATRLGRFLTQFPILCAEHI